VRLDVGLTETFPEFAEQVRRELRDRWQRDSFDYLVNNAGMAKQDVFPDVTQDLFEASFRVIMRGPYFLTQTFLPLIADNGAIVNTTSNSALPTGLTAGYSVYASVKGGLITRTQYLAKELAPCRSR